jgi:hypothetical protein
MDINWAHAAPTVLAAFFASLVEFIEALTIVLAVGTVRGWRSAIGGAALAPNFAISLPYLDKLLPRQFPHGRRHKPCPTVRTIPVSTR